MDQMLLLMESNNAKVVKLHALSQNMPLVGSFDLVKGVILDIGDYNLNGAMIHCPLSVIYCEKQYGPVVMVVCVLMMSLLYS